LIATPRLGLETLQKANIPLDALIGSALDPDEYVDEKSLDPPPKLRIATEGSAGGKTWPNGPYKAMSLSSPAIDTYGCGDSFAAGVTAGLSAGWCPEKAISLGSICGAKTASHLGPYNKEINLSMK